MVLFSQYVLKNFLLIFVKTQIGLLNNKTFEAILLCVDVSEKVYSDRFSGIALTQDAPSCQPLSYKVKVREVIIDAACLSCVHQHDWAAEGFFRSEKSLILLKLI